MMDASLLISKILFEKEEKEKNHKAQKKLFALRALKINYESLCQKEATYEEYIAQCEHLYNAMECDVTLQELVVLFKLPPTATQIPYLETLVNCRKLDDDEVINRYRSAYLEFQLNIHNENERKLFESAAKEFNELDQRLRLAIASIQSISFELARVEVDPAIKIPLLYETTEKALQQLKRITNEQHYLFLFLKNHLSLLIHEAQSTLGFETKLNRLQIQEQQLITTIAQCHTPGRKQGLNRQLKMVNEEIDALRQKLSSNSTQPQTHIETAALQNLKKRYAEALDQLLQILPQHIAKKQSILQQLKAYEAASPHNNTRNGKLFEVVPFGILAEYYQNNDPKPEAKTEAYSPPKYTR